MKAVLLLSLLSAGHLSLAFRPTPAFSTPYPIPPPLSCPPHSSALRPPSPSTRLQTALRTAANPLQRGPPALRMGLFDFLQPKGWSETQADLQAGVPVADQEGLPFATGALLQSTFIAGRELTLAYRASTDGWSAKNFHDSCDNKGPCVVFATTDDGYSFGGFNPNGWQSDDDYKTLPNAFLFFCPPQGGDPVRLDKVGGGEAALFDYARSGPTFGADGLVIGASSQSVMGLFAGPDPMDVTTGQGELRSVVSRLGQSYACIPPEWGQSSILGGDREAATLAECEVYYCKELADMFQSLL